MGAPVASDGVRSYFATLLKQVEAAYAIARAARARGYDPELDVEIPLTDDLASRVEKLLEHYDVAGVARRIRELAKHHDREELAILVAKEMAQRPAASKERAVERAVRVGVAILTEGILVAPLEGLAGVKLKRNRDGSSYVDLYYAGPIRSAGGTGQALSVLIADVVRRELGIGRYEPVREEVERFKEEIPLYKQAQHLQYTPSEEEIALIVAHCPVGINGEGTEDAEISGFRDLPRIETNRIRGGACLVIADGMCLKAPKIQKHVKKLRIDGWEFIDAYLEEKSARPEELRDEAGVEPSEVFIQNIVAGRPVLCHPSRAGGLRLRYGRTRATGLAALALHPATMHVLDDFIAVGTQIKTERPGKAGAVTPCDRIERPHHRGSRRDPRPVRRVPREQPCPHARRLLPRVVRRSPRREARLLARRVGDGNRGTGAGVVARAWGAAPSPIQPLLPRPDGRRAGSTPRSHRRPRPRRVRPTAAPERRRAARMARAARRAVPGPGGRARGRAAHGNVAGDARHRTGW